MHSALMAKHRNSGALTEVMRKPGDTDEKLLKARVPVCFITRYTAGTQQEVILYREIFSVSG